MSYEVTDNLMTRMCRPRLTLCTTILFDFLMANLAGLTVLLIRFLLEPFLSRGFGAVFYVQVTPVVAFALILLLFMGKMYPGLPSNPPRELKMITILCLGYGLGIGMLTFITREVEVYSRFMIIGGSLMSIPYLFVGRQIWRRIASGFQWWGIPIVFVGSGRDGRRVLKYLLRNPEVGMRPVGVFGDPHGREIGGVPHLGEASQVIDLLKKEKHLYVLVVARDLKSSSLKRLINMDQRLMRHVIIIPDLHGVTSYGVDTTDLGGLLGIYVQQRLLDPWRMIVKRILDLSLVIFFSPLIMMVMLIVALVIKSDSRGPLFFSHARIGRGGKTFNALKFRTMVPDADRVLEAYLAEHPELLEEWEKTQKLKHDPRVSRAGRFLRRFSLDEFPQIINVFLGQMSLVGPRPIVEKEIKRYGETYILYEQVRPGITGLWQVSGRNDLPYHERVRLDGRYIRNWSVWLDIYILTRTFLAVIQTRGAY